MVLSLKESQACTEMAKLLYSFLPGSGASAWKGHVSFRTVAEKIGFKYRGLKKKDSFIDGKYVNGKKYRLSKEDWLNSKK